MIVIAYAEKLLTDEEFMFLYEANKPVNLELPYYEYEEFNLEENISEVECKAEFRFERGDIERLADVLQLPPTFGVPTRKCLRPNRGTLYPSSPACVSMSLQRHG